MPRPDREEREPRDRAVVVLAYLRDRDGNVVAEAITTYLVEQEPRRWR